MVAKLLAVADAFVSDGSGTYDLLSDTVISLIGTPSLRTRSGSSCACRIALLVTIVWNNDQALI